MKKWQRNYFKVRNTMLTLKFLENEDEFHQGFYVSKLLTYFLENKYGERTKWVAHILTNITRYKYSS
jgi:hypothetical protein